MQSKMKETSDKKKTRHYDIIKIIVDLLRTKQKIKIIMRSSNMVRRSTEEPKPIHAIIKSNKWMENKRINSVIMQLIAVILAIHIKIENANEKSKKCRVFC